jgi:bacterioferritin-associated ferredoxin
MVIRSLVRVAAAVAVWIECPAGMQNACPCLAQCAVCARSLQPGMRHAEADY